MLNTDHSCLLQNMTALLSVWTLRDESLSHIACILVLVPLYLACFHLAAGLSLLTVVSSLLSCVTGLYSYRPFFSAFELLTSLLSRQTFWFCFLSGHSAADYSLHICVRVIIF